MLVQEISGIPPKPKIEPPQGRRNTLQKHHIRNTGGVVPVRVGEGVVQVRVEPARVSPVVQVAAGEPSQ